MIVASRMNWAALTPSRWASRSTRGNSASEKRTVVALIGMPANVPGGGGSATASVKMTTQEAREVRFRNLFRVDMRQMQIAVFEECYGRYAADVFRAANGVLRDACLAEDVVQEVFEHFWRGS